MTTFCVLSAENTNSQKKTDAMFKNKILPALAVATIAKIIPTASIFIFCKAINNELYYKNLHKRVSIVHIPLGFVFLISCGFSSRYMHSIWHDNLKEKMQINLFSLASQLKIAPNQKLEVKNIKKKWSTKYQYEYWHQFQFYKTWETRSDEFIEFFILFKL